MNEIERVQRAASEYLWFCFELLQKRDIVAKQMLCFLHTIMFILFKVIKIAFHENGLQFDFTCWVNEPYGWSSYTPSFSYTGQTDALKKWYIKLNC